MAYRPKSAETKEIQKRRRSDMSRHDLKNMLFLIYGSAELARLIHANSEGQQKHMDRIYKTVPAEAKRIV
jgi:hypothetical protein